MTYDEALAYIHGCKMFGSKKNGISNMERLMDRLGNSHELYPVVHVAGTNGKGSTCAMISSVLMASGMKTAMYTSPYLERFNERIRVNGVPINDDELAQTADEVICEVKALVAGGMDHPTEFELGTAIAFHYFAKRRVDVALIEVGIGGRLDSTNVVMPEVSVICAVGLDHTKLLGNNVEQIAAEKAGIIKASRPVALYPQGENVRSIVSNRSAQLGCKLLDLATAKIEIEESGLKGHTFSLYADSFQYTDLRIELLGKHQIYNACTAIAALELLAQRHPEWRICDNIKKGLLNAKWPGRLEIASVSPFVVLDGAHNPHAAKALAAAAAELFPQKKIILVAGILSGKDAEAVATELMPICSHIIATAPDSPRAYEAEKLAELFSKGKAAVTSITGASAALDFAMNMCDEDSVVIVAGSLYLVGELRSRFHLKNPATQTITLSV